MHKICGKCAWGYTGFGIVAHIATTVRSVVKTIVNPTNISENSPETLQAIQNSRL